MDAKERLRRDVPLLPEGEEVKHDSFLRLLRQLRKELPLRLPVRVRRTRLPLGKLGDCGLYEQPEPHFRIRVNSDIGKEAQYIILVHEWAHARAWFAEDEDHDFHFGGEYARAWRIAERDD